MNLVLTSIPSRQSRNTPSCSEANETEGKPWEASTSLVVHLVTHLTYMYLPSYPVPSLCEVFLILSCFLTLHVHLAETTGRAVVGGAALFGVGALCYYGLGLSNEVGAIDRAMVWPQVVRDRVRSTYSYFAGSLALTAGTAYAISQSRAVYTLMRASPWLVSSIILNLSLMKLSSWCLVLQYTRVFIRSRVPGTGTRLLWTEYQAT